MCFISLDEEKNYNNLIAQKIRNCLTGSIKKYITIMKPDKTLHLLKKLRREPYVFIH